MANLMQLDVLSPDEYVFRADNITFVNAMTQEGGVGILPRHATMVASLEPAPLKYRDDEGKAHYLFVAGGFLEVKNNKVTVLTVDAQAAEAIDVPATEKAVKEAEAKLANPGENTDVAEVELELAIAKARLQTVATAKNAD